MVGDGFVGITILADGGRQGLGGLPSSPSRVAEKFGWLVWLAPANAERSEILPSSFGPIGE